MYVTMFPCNECSKLLIQAGIAEIVFYEDKAVPVRDASPNEGNNVRSVAPLSHAMLPSVREARHSGRCR